jgi:hypothetical protein
MIVIEAVRTGCWNAVTDQRRVLLIEECAEELRRGDASVVGYVPVREQELARARIEPLSSRDRVAFRLAYPDADRLDPGERDMLAWTSTCTEAFEICSCDKAAVRAANALGWLDRVVSLEVVAASVGARTTTRFKRQFTESVMVAWRTSLRIADTL